jgi:hypothetical protein
MAAFRKLAKLSDFATPQKSNSKKCHPDPQAKWGDCLEPPWPSACTDLRTEHGSLGLCYIGSYALFNPRRFLNTWENRVIRTP